MIKANLLERVYSQRTRTNSIFALFLTSTTIVRKWPTMMVKIVILSKVSRFLEGVEETHGDRISSGNNGVQTNIQIMIVGKCHIELLLVV